MTDRRFSSSMKLTCPPLLPLLVDQVAAQKMTSRADYIRRAVLAALAADGVDATQGRYAVEMPELAHAEEWQAEAYAVVDGDHVLDFITGPMPTDGREWLPVFNVDEQPFDIAKHYRLKPRLERDGQIVKRIFPIVDQAKWRGEA